MFKENQVTLTPLTKFYLPFDGFKTNPIFSDISQYMLYKEGVMNFIKSRNKRIENYIKLHQVVHDANP